MSHEVDVRNDRVSLRQRAVAQLAVGTLKDVKPASMSDALTVLYQLASSPSTAGDALALLHELQVHQVELDLQQEELLNSQSELEKALLRQTSLVERAPVGYMTIDARTVLYEINFAGARLLAAERDNLPGRRLDGLMAEPSASALHSLLARAGAGSASQTCELRLRPLAGESRTVHATVDTDTTSGYFLLALMPAAPPSPADVA